MTEAKPKPIVTVETVTAYAAPPKDKDGNLIKEDGKTVKGAILGTDTVRQYSTDQKGLDAAIKQDSVKVVVDNHNRQTKTDTRNRIAADAKTASDPEKKIKRDIAKVHKGITEEKRAQLNSELAALLNKYQDIENTDTE